MENYKRDEKASIKARTKNIIIITKRKKKRKLHGKYA